MITDDVKARRFGTIGQDRTRIGIVRAVGKGIRSYTSTAKELANYFGVSRNTVYNWLGSTAIPHRKIGGVIRFNLAEVDEWARERSGGARDSATSEIHPAEALPEPIDGAPTGASSE
jgi:excisionase family DNA binding protein